MSPRDDTIRRTRIVLEGLLMGIPVHYHGQSYALDSRYEVCVWRIKLRANLTPERVLVSTGMTVQDFILMCRDMDEYHLTAIAGNITLNKL